MRGDLVREVLLVSSGPAGVATAGTSGGAAVAVEDAQRTAAQSAASTAWLKPPAPAAQPAPSTKRLNHVGGAQVKDPVPVGLRGQKPEGLMRHFPKHLLSKALKLQEERNTGGGSGSGGQ